MDQALRMKCAQRFIMTKYDPNSSLLAYDPSEDKGLRSAGSDLITKIETFLVKPRSWVFVRVETKNGIVGWGETMLDGHSDAIIGAFEDFKTRLIGWDPANIEDIWQHLFRHRFHRGGPVLQAAIAGWASECLHTKRWH
jgi:galactonate dehydratase